MQTTDANILQFLSDPSVRYFMPAFQRGYEWEFRHYADLFRGLMEAAEDRRFHYWMGTVIIGKNESHRLAEWNDGITVYNVVDGQQRIISISLMLQAIRAALRTAGLATMTPEQNADPNEYRAALLHQKIIIATLIDHNPKRPKVVVAKKNREVYNAVMAEQHPLEGDGFCQVHLAAQYFYREIRGKTAEEQTKTQILERAERLMGALQHQGKISRAEMGPEDSAEQIFVRANSKGKQLTPAEHINGFIQTNVSPIESEQSEFQEKYWEPLEKRIQRESPAAIINQTQAELKEGRPCDPMSTLLDFTIDYLHRPDGYETKEGSGAGCLRQVERIIRSKTTRPSQTKLSREEAEKLAEENSAACQKQAIETLKSIEIAGNCLLTAINPWKREEAQPELLASPEPEQKPKIGERLRSALEDLASLPEPGPLRLAGFWLFEWQGGRLEEETCIENIRLLENVFSRRCICNKPEVGDSWFRTTIGIEQKNRNPEYLRMRLAEKNPSNQEVRRCLLSYARCHQKASKLHILLRVENSLRREAGKKALSPEGFQTTELQTNDLLNEVERSAEMGEKEMGVIRKSLANHTLFRNRRPKTKEAIQKKIMPGFESTAALKKTTCWRSLEEFQKWEGRFLKAAMATWPEIVGTNDQEEGSWETHYCTAIIKGEVVTHKAARIPWKQVTSELLQHVWEKKRQMFPTCMEILGETNSYLRTEARPNYERIFPECRYFWFKGIGNKQLQHLHQAFLQASQTTREEFRTEMAPKDTEEQGAEQPVLGL